MFNQGLVDETPVVRNDLLEPSEHVEPHKAGDGKEPCEHVGDGHGDEEEVGGVAHRSSHEDDADEGVGHKGEGDE